MKKILQAMDGAKTKAEVNSSDMKKFLRAVTEADVNQPAKLPAAPKFYITQTTYDSLNEPPDFSVTDLQRGIIVASFDSEEQARAYVAQKDPAGAAQTELHQMQSKATAPEANPDAMPQQTVSEEVGMSRFLSIVTEGKGPLNRSTAAEAMTMQHYTAPKKTITNPVLNVQEGATPSMIGKYFKAVETELAEAEIRSKDRARQLAERVIERVTPNADGSLPDPSINRLTGKPNPPAEPAPTNVKPSGSTVDYGGATYNLVGVFGDGIRPRIGRGDKVIPAKAYVLGDKMYVLLDQGVAEAEIDRPGMKDGRPYSDPYRRHPGNSSYMTPEYMIQKYKERLEQIAAGPYKRPKEVAQLQSRIAKLEKQGVAEVAGPEKCWPGHRKVGTQPGTGKNAGKRVNDCEKIKPAGKK